VSILPDIAVLNDHHMLRRKHGFPPIANTELALLMAPDVTSGTRRLAGLLAEFCGASAARDAARLVPPGSPSLRSREKSPC
jgi:hypothetical protein